MSSTTKLYSPNPLKAAPNVDSLLDQVDQLQNAMDSDFVERLLEENVWLEHSIKRGEEKWQSTTKLLREAFEAYVVLNACIEDLEKEIRGIDGKWAHELQEGLSEMSVSEFPRGRRKAFSPIGKGLSDH